MKQKNYLDKIFHDLNIMKINIVLNLYIEPVEINKYKINFFLHT